MEKLEYTRLSPGDFRWQKRTLLVACDDDIGVTEIEEMLEIFTRTFGEQDAGD